MLLYVNGIFFENNSERTAIQKKQVSVQLATLAYNMAFRTFAAVDSPLSSSKTPSLFHFRFKPISSTNPPHRILLFLRHNWLCELTLIIIFIQQINENR